MKSILSKQSRLTMKPLAAILLIVLGLTACSQSSEPKTETAQSNSADASAKVYNIGCSHPVKLMDFITAIENKLGRKIEKNMMPIQAGDVPATYADVKDLVEDLGYKPATPIQDGINKFVDWYLDFFGYNKDGSKK